jgi:hypothetical protein
MFERIRFARYALRFERAFKSDDWTDVKACFHPEAIYAIEGSNTEYDGEYRGPDAIAGCFKRMLDEADRKFDKRSPGLRGWPSVKNGVMTMPWRVRYTKGADSVVLNGTARCRFQDGKIIELRDTMVADEVKRWAAMVA